MEVVKLEIQNGIKPFELECWDLLFLKLSARELKRATKIYNPGLPDVVPLQHSGIRKSNQKLRIGFMAGHWMCHTTTYIARGLLRSIDRRKFEVFSLVTMRQERKDDICRDDIKTNSTSVDLPEAVSLFKSHLFKSKIRFNIFFVYIRAFLLKRWLKQSENWTWIF